MDKRKNNGGHSTKATKEDDKRLNPFRDAIKKACTEEDVIAVLQMLYTSAIETKSTRAAKIYLEYALGKPKETIDLSVFTEQPLFPDV